MAKGVGGTGAGFDARSVGKLGQRGGWSAGNPSDPKQGLTLVHFSV